MSQACPSTPGGGKRSSRKRPAPLRGAQSTETSLTHHVHVAAPTPVVGGQGTAEGW